MRRPVTGRTVCAAAVSVQSIDTGKYVNIC
jgi:hypothetical protein